MGTYEYLKAKLCIGIILCKWDFDAIHMLPLALPFHRLSLSLSLSFISLSLKNQKHPGRVPRGTGRKDAPGSDLLISVFIQKHCSHHQAILLRSSPQLLWLRWLSTT